MQPESQVAGGDSGPAAGRHRRPLAHPGGLVERLQRGGGLDGLGGGVVEVEERQIERAGHVAAAQPRPRLGLGGGEAAAAARIQHLLATAVEIGAQLVDVAHQRAPRARRERPRPRARPAGLQGPPFGDPFCGAAVEHRDIVVAEDAEAPPHPGGATHPGGVVGDDAGAVAEAEGADAFGEDLGRGQHVGKRRGVVGDAIDVEEHRPRNVPALELRARVAPELRHVPGAIDHAHVRRLEMLGEPRRGNQGVGIGVGHGDIPLSPRFRRRQGSG